MECSTTIDADIPTGLHFGSYDLTLTDGEYQQVILESAFEVLALPVIFLPLIVR
ncbi:MAG: hypothetical protein WAM09_00180 [Anaerolineales bacterium]